MHFFPMGKYFAILEYFIYFFTFLRTANSMCDSPYQLVEVDDDSQQQRKNNLRLPLTKCSSFKKGCYDPAKFPCNPIDQSTW